MWVMRSQMMRNFFLPGLLALSLAVAAPGAAAAGSLKATINGMVCAFCAQGIEKRLMKLPEAKAVHVDLKRRRVRIGPREGSQLDEQRVATEIREAGYEVVSLEASPKSLEALRQELKAAK